MTQRLPLVVKMIWVSLQVSESFDLCDFIISALNIEMSAI